MLFQAVMKFLSRLVEVCLDLFLSRPCEVFKFCINLYYARENAPLSAQFRSAIFSTFYNILRRNFAILLIKNMLFLAVVMDFVLLA